MGFIDYALETSIQKDNTKVKIFQDATIKQPVLEQDKYGFTVKLPTAESPEDGQISFLGITFPVSLSSKDKIGRLFRAAVLHLTTHTLTPLPKENVSPNTSDSYTEAFAKALMRDTYVNAYLQALHPNRLIDIAYANALLFQKIKPAEKIFASSTKVMSALLSRVNVGVCKGDLESDEEKAVNSILTELSAPKETFLASFAGEQINLQELFDDKIKSIKGFLEDFRPFFEAPSLSYTENIGKSSIYSRIDAINELHVERDFRKSIETLGGSAPADVAMESLWRKEQSAEATQAFNSEQNQKERREKILVKIAPLVSRTHFKGVDFPDEDYTQYLRARSLVQGANRRLLEMIRQALNLLYEDPRQEVGELDLSAVIQAIASNKPALDVFSLENFLKQSFAWSVLFDASSSMQVRGEYSRALAIAVAEAARELMNDPTSWTFFAFSDKLQILKASNESYSKTVRARIGGLRFEGLTFMPDAVTIAEKMLAKRYEEQRCLIVISDGWPYGYNNLPTALKESVDGLLRKGVIIIGIGVETDRMDNFFRLNASVYTPKDLVKKFGNVYLEASAKALET